MPHLRPGACCAALLLATAAGLVSGRSQAAEVLVVTDSVHPVRAPAGARIIELDRAAGLEGELARNLPSDLGTASAAVQQRLRAGGDALQQRLAQAWQGVAEAWGIGVDKLPAVVVDRRYVIYGEPDVARAIDRITAFRQQEHQP